MLTYSHVPHKVTKWGKHLMDKTRRMIMKAVYPGTFDPITNGHLDIIARASAMFDEVVVLIMQNPAKKCMFSEAERITMIQKSVEGLPHAERISVMCGNGLTVSFAESIGASAIIRGIRAVSDYEYELMQATANMYLNSSIETFLMIARPEYSFLSSSVIKEIGIHNGSIRGLVPESIHDHIAEELKNRSR